MTDIYYITSESTQIVTLIIGSIGIITALLAVYLSLKYKHRFPYNKHIKGFFPVFGIGITIVILVYWNVQKGLNVTGGTRFGFLIELIAQEALINTVICQVWRLYLQTAYQMALLEGKYSSNVISNMRKYAKWIRVRNSVILSIIEGTILWIISDIADHDVGSVELYIVNIALGLQPLIAAIVFIPKFKKLNSGFKDGTGIMFEIKVTAIGWVVGLIFSNIFVDDDGSAYSGLTIHSAATVLILGAIIEKFHKQKKTIQVTTPAEVELTIKNPASANNFAKFLAGEFSSENFYFIVLVLRLVNQKENKTDLTRSVDGLLAKTRTTNTTSDEKDEKDEEHIKIELLDSMRSCYSRFVARDSAYQVNLPGPLVKKFKSEFSKDQPDTEVLMGLFLKAKKEIIGLLVRDPFKRWIDHDLYVAVDDMNAKIKKTDKPLIQKQLEDEEEEETKLNV